MVRIFVCLILQKPPFTKEQAPEVLGVTFFFNYMNRIVDTYVTQDATLPTMPWFLKLLMKFSLTKVGTLTSTKSFWARVTVGQGIFMHESTCC